MDQSSDNCNEQSSDNCNEQSSDNCNEQSSDYCDGQSSDNCNEQSSDYCDGQSSDSWDDDQTSNSWDDDQSSNSWGDDQTLFEQIYRCSPLSTIQEKSHLNSGDKIIMPLSALDRLKNIEDYPMLFQIENPCSDRVSHCGVLEFTAEEGFVYLPDWMMKNMKLKEREDIILKSSKLPKGTFMKLQPHSMDFTRIQDLKEVLEEALRKFSCLTVGDTIMITHETKEFYIDIVETQPGSAISVIDTDCEADFATPLDYKEPEKPKPALLEKQEKARGVAEQAETVKEEMKFEPFCGVSRRLDGKILVTELGAADGGIDNEDSLPDIGSHRRPGKVVFGSDVSQISTISEKAAKDDVKVETGKIEEPKFQAFTGKKYTLAGGPAILI